MGTQIFLGNPPANVEQWIKNHYGPKCDALCFTAKEANSTVSMEARGSAPSVSLEYSTDGNTWSPFVVGSTTVTLANIGDKMWVRATGAGNTRMGASVSDHNGFNTTGKIAASGNVDTLLDQNGNATLTDYCYSYLFSGANLTTAPELPATTLADGCYYYMFYGCTSLTTAPELPATTLADNCYSNMFEGCTSLETAPVLPATTLANSCYAHMFNGCTSLTTAPELPATTLAGDCYSNMFYGCTSLTTALELPATTLAGGCYSNMFQGCSSLTTAPAILPATTLDYGCYGGMFWGCTSLTTAPELPATTLANYCYMSMFNGCTNLNTITLGYTGNFADAPEWAFNDWVNGVASEGTFYYNGSDTTTGESAIPRGWTVSKWSR